MSEPNDVLNLVNPPQFDSDKWIGKGRTYPAKPEDVLMELSLYCDHLLEIPDHVRKDAFPDASFTVEKFLQLKLLDSSNVAAVSNIPVQLFDHILRVQFRAIPGGQTLHVKRFCLLPSSAFLCTLDVAPSETENRLKISPQDGVLFRNLKDSSAGIQKAVASLASRGKKAQVPDDTDEEVED
jgi:hypothetical protein